MKTLYKDCNNKHFIQNYFFFLSFYNLFNYKNTNIKGKETKKIIKSKYYNNCVNYQ